MIKEQVDYVYIIRFFDQFYLFVRCFLCIVLNVDWIGKWDGLNIVIKIIVILLILVQLLKKSIVVILFFDQICVKYYICLLVMQIINSYYRIFIVRLCILMLIYVKFIQYYLV